MEKLFLTFFNFLFSPTCSRIIRNYIEKLPKNDSKTIQKQNIEVHQPISIIEYRSHIYHVHPIRWTRDLYRREYRRSQKQDLPKSNVWPHSSKNTFALPQPTSTDPMILATRSFSISFLVAATKKGQSFTIQ